MQILSTPGDFVLYKQENPYYNVVGIKNYAVETEGVVFADEFRWSTDDITFSAWIELTEYNLRTLQLNPAEQFWIEFRVTLVSGGPVKVGEFHLEVETADFNPYEGYTPPEFGCSETGNITCITRIQDLCFKPYNVNAAACLYADLSYMVNTLFGHEVEYYRAIPDKRAEDITLMEYTLYNVEDSQCAKVLVPGNEFPDAKLAYNPFGIDFEMPFEVHIDKQYWEEIFGYDTAPQKRDIVYFPLTRRIYEVQSSYLFRAFMERDSYWKVNLVKYSPKANRYEANIVRDTLDSLSTSVTEEFEKEMRETEEKITISQQYNPFIGNRDYDPSRESINNKITVIEEKLVNFSTLISEFQYSLMNLTNFSQNTIAVQYREPVIFGKSDERSYSSWFSPKSPLVFVPTDNVNNFVLLGNQLTVNLAANRNYSVGDYLKLTRIGGLTLYGEITTVTSLTSFILTIEQEVIDSLNNLNPMWTGLNSFKAEKITPVNFLNGYDEENQVGVKINMFAERYFVITFNEDRYIFSMDKDLKRDYWYGLHLNISNKFKQLNVNVWERKWKENIASSPQTTELFNIFNNTINGIDFPVSSNTLKYSLLASNVLITNIRLYDQTAEIEKQAIMLNQNIVQNADRALIIDNALPRLTLPFIAQSK